MSGIGHPAAGTRRPEEPLPPTHYRTHGLGNRKRMTPAWNVNGLLLSLAILNVLIAPTNSFAQNPKPIFDGRLTLKPAGLSPWETKLMKDKVAPDARKEWRKRKRDAICDSGFQPTALDIAPGAFTTPKAEQKAILYKYCTIGHGMALDGIAIVENGQLVAHVVFEGGENRAIGALPDINGNGLSEIVIVSGGTNQRITSAWISMIKLAGAEITRLGQAETSSDNCGVDENNCKITANRISVRSGKTPAFYREVFVDTGSGSGLSSWRKLGALTPISLDKDQVEYEFLK